MAATEAQLEKLYRERAPAYCDAVAAITGSRETARDAVQDAFARALVERSRFRGTGTLEGWVWRIALRSAFGAHRRRRWPLSRGDEPVVADAVLAEPGSDPELRLAIRGLSPRRRLFVFLHYYADLSYPQIAEACEVSEGTVAAALSQARSQLYAALTEEATHGV
jgi:RNA polymerase sigma factor (sigma-70 family)